MMRRPARPKSICASPARRPAIRASTASIRRSGSAARRQARSRRDDRLHPCRQPGVPDDRRLYKALGEAKRRHPAHYQDACFTGDYPDDADRSGRCCRADRSIGASGRTCELGYQPSVRPELVEGRVPRQSGRQAQPERSDMNEKPLADRIALVTGAGRGTPRRDSRARRGSAHVILTARSADELEAVEDAIFAAGGSATIAPLDLTETDSIARLATASANAGAGRRAGAERRSPRHARRCPGDRSGASQCRCSPSTSPPAALLAVDPAAQRRCCAVIGLTSSVGRSRAYWGMYGASKAASRTLLAAYGDEIENISKVRVAILDPGATRTKMRARLSGRGPADGQAARGGGRADRGVGRWTGFPANSPSGSRGQPSASLLPARASRSAVADDLGGITSAGTPTSGSWMTSSPSPASSGTHSRI